MNYCTGKIAQEKTIETAHFYAPGDLPVQFQVAHRISTVADRWDEVVPTNQLFLRSSYLQALESAPPPGMDFRYLLVLQEGRAVGVIYSQLTEFDAFESLQGQWNGSPQKWYDPLRKWLARQLRFKIQVCGNLLVSGPHGYYLSKEIADHGKIVSAGLDILTRVDRNIRGTFIKDFPKEMEMDVHTLEGQGYQSFCFLPGMEMKLSRDWDTFGDYMGALSSKYRVRARRAFKARSEVETRELSLSEVEVYQEELYVLYRQVADHVDFNMARVSGDYLFRMKEQLPDEFHIRGFFLEDRLIGFISYFTTGPELEAHFIGFDQSLQRTHQLYLNILYELIDTGIQFRMTRIHFARTAMEIKSSVGALPATYTCLIGVQHPLLRLFLRPLVRLLDRPMENWEQRHPFK